MRISIAIGSLLLINILATTGNVTTDNVISDRISATNNLDSVALFEEGDAFLDLNEYSNALDAYNKAIDIDPDNAAIWNNKGISLAAMERYRDSLEAFDRSIEINSHWGAAWNNRGNALDAMGKYYDALEAYERAITLYDAPVSYHGNSCWYSWYNKGTILAAIGRYNDSLEAYKNNGFFAGPKEASRGMVLYVLSKTFDGYGCVVIAMRNATAMKKNGVIIENDIYGTESYTKFIINIKNGGLMNFDSPFYSLEVPKTLDAVNDWFSKGVRYYDTGSYEFSIKCYDKAIELNPNLPELWFNKGAALYAQDKYNAAMQAYEIAIELDPNDADAWLNKGNALKKLGHNAEADAAFAKARKLGYTG